MSFSLATGHTQQMSVALIDGFGATLRGIGVPVWASSNPLVASVNSVGVVTGVADGIATISAAFGGIVGTSVVTVSSISTIVSDSFTRADSATSLGSADTGQSWNPISGTWGISTNRAYLPSGTGFAVIDSTKANVTVQCTWISPQLGTDRPRLIFRLADANNYWLIDPVNATTLQMYKNVAGGFTQVGSDATHTWATGDVVKVVLSGDSIAAYINGVLAIGPATDAFNDTATSHGLGVIANSASLFMDNFLVTVP